MTEDIAERIKARAHQLWLEEGQPGGKAHVHWAQAEQDMNASRDDIADATDYVMQTDEGTLNQDAEPIAAKT